MPHRIPADVFITTLTELLHHDRDVRAAVLIRHSKDQARHFLLRRPHSDATRLTLGKPYNAHASEAPDCVSFISNTLKGATP
ncbi:MAG: hypothetical protein ACK4RZ_11575 [Paracoccaceae bacterium]